MRIRFHSLGLGIIAGLFLPAAVAQKTPDVRLNTDPAGTARSGRPIQIAASGSSVYVTWEDERNGSFDIYFNRSLDAGATWLGSDVRLDTDPTGSARSFAPEIAASGSSVYVTWDDERNGSTDIYFNIPFGSQPYGTGKAGSGGFVPELTGTDDLNLGSTYSLQVTSGLGGANGVFVFGFGLASQLSVPIVGGTLLVDPVILLPFALDGSSGVPGAGSLSAPIVVPPLIRFLGVNLNAQVGILDPGATFGISMTNAVEAWIL